MENYLRSENLKLKNTFTKKLIIIMPIISVLLGHLSPSWYVINSFNWWYMMILPGNIALIAFLVHQKEQKKQKYIGVMCLPINLKKLWISKILLISFFNLLSCMILCIGVLPGRFYWPNAYSIPIINLIIGAVVIAITSMWQIPLCLFLAKKVGLFPTIFINTLAGVVLNIIMVNRGLWWICPYSITTRLMCPILRILPNGMLAERGNMLLNSNVIWIGIALSILFFVFLTFATAHWFSKQEVK
ncbi:lantibiotic immunity ABC transporter MutE/EpiE family permease subunit [Clostridium sp.]|uniref:lantibiotic immunity ABC transporter MutE/EpiE family permease subunit n=1 Tax=Clostridium sp. TaxID=1506 RepID=UPI0032164BF7